LSAYETTQYAFLFDDSGPGPGEALTWKLEPAADGTNLSLTYALGGYNKDGFAELSQAGDGVLTAQMGRLN